MNAYVKPQLFISPLAKTWGTQLIKDLNVQQTACLSHFLDVNHCYDGHDATYIWANRYLNDHENIEFVAVESFDVLSWKAILKTIIF